MKPYEPENETIQRLTQNLSDTERMFLFNTLPILYGDDSTSMEWFLANEWAGGAILSGDLSAIIQAYRTWRREIYLPIPTSHTAPHEWKVI